MSRSTQWRAIGAAVCALAAGIGLARFAYAPLVPALVAEHWVSSSEAAYLGAANLSGYLVGALWSRRLIGRRTPAVIMRAMMLGTVIALFACGFPLGIWWLTAWRFLGGIFGAAIMVIAAPTVIASVAVAKRGRDTGVIFLGVGLGIIASGTVIPALLRHGLALTWFGLGGTCLGLALVAWPLWPDRWPSAHSPSQPVEEDVKEGVSRDDRAVRALILAYAVLAIGLVPYSVFYVDYLVRGLRLSTTTAAHDWMWYGVGAVIGPLITGGAIDRIGARAALRWAFSAQAAALAFATLACDLPAMRSLLLVLSAIIMGAMTPGVAPIAIARVRQLVRGHVATATHTWGSATLAFASFQAAGAYALSWTFSRTGSYAMVFWTGSIASAVALLLMLCFDRSSALDS